MKEEIEKKYALSTVDEILIKLEKERLLFGVSFDTTIVIVLMMLSELLREATELTEKDRLAEPKGIEKRQTILSAYINDLHIQADRLVLESTDTKSNVTKLH